MTEQLERELRHLFAEDAERATEGTSLLEGARRRVRQRRRTRFAWAGGAVAASVAALATVAALTGGPAGSPDGDPPAVAGKGPLPDAGANSCVEQYSPQAVTGRAFAFAGTVTAIGPGTTNRAGGGELDLASVTFTVDEWFAGGSGETVTVDLTPPDAAPASDGTGPAYAVGTRLLVSGQPRWGGGPLTDALAWGCGFTRYHDEATAAQWRAAFG